MKNSVGGKAKRRGGGRTGERFQLNTAVKNPRRKKVKAKNPHAYAPQKMRDNNKPTQTTPKKEGT